jgi:hypothetical protein
MKALLDQCVRRNWYGDEASTIRHFITIGLERLIEQHRLIDEPTAASTPSTDETPAASEPRQ